MRIVVCAGTQAGAERLCTWIEGRCRQHRLHWEVLAVVGLEAFWTQYAPDRIQCLYLDVGDASGFAAARRLREGNKNCPIVLVSDTDRFAIRSLRIHVTDYLIHPLSQVRVERSVDRVLSW